MKYDYEMLQHVFAVATSVENLKVGSMFARCGAWNRKYRAVKVETRSPGFIVLGFRNRGLTEITTEHFEKYKDHYTNSGRLKTPEVDYVIEVTLENLGSYYADGRVVPAKRKSLTKHQFFVLKSGEVMKDNSSGGGMRVVGCYGSSF